MTKQNKIISLKERKEQTLVKLTEINKELLMMEKVHSDMVNKQIRLQNRLELLNELEPEQSEEEKLSKK